jgi:class 3 adenylate cyclase
MTTRRLAASLAADVVGYREAVDPAIAAHKGGIVKTTSDRMLVEFGSAVDAVNCAMGVQTTSRVGRYQVRRTSEALAEAPSVDVA